MSAHETIRVFVKILKNLDAWMLEAEETAKARSFEVDVLADARLAPDQYRFAQQVQATCDQAKFAAAYLSGKAAPSHPDTEKTFAELHARVAACLEFVESIGAAEFEGSDARKVSPGWLGGAWLHGSDYLAEVAVPNFYFHATTAYAILRHNGVPLGKLDFIGVLPVQQG